MNNKKLYDALYERDVFKEYHESKPVLISIMLGLIIASAILFVSAHNIAAMNNKSQMESLAECDEAIYGTISVNNVSVQQ